MSEVFDVVVVGLGPAGALAARGLAKRGLRVAAIDRAAFPRYKVCGGCLNARALGALKRSEIDPAPLRGVPIQGFEGGFGARKVVLDLPGGLAVSRAGLDEHLAAAARESGATIHFDTLCGALRRDGDVWIVSTESNGGASVLRARYVVGADGLGGVVRKHTGLFNTRVQAQSRAGAGTLLDGCGLYEPGVIYMAVGGAGYVGLTVVEDCRLNVAAALDVSAMREVGAPARVAELILNECAFPVPAGLLDAVWKGTPPLSQTTRPVGVDGLFLVGDAAGYVEPFTGEGMAWALEGAEALAQILAETLQGGGETAERRWNREYARRFAGGQRRCRAIARGLRSAGITATVAAVLGAMPGLARPVVAQLNAAVE